MYCINNVKNLIGQEKYCPNESHVINWVAVLLATLDIRLHQN